MRELCTSLRFTQSFYFKNILIFDGVWCRTKRTFKNVRPYVELVTKIRGTFREDSSEIVEVNYTYHAQTASLKYMNSGESENIIIIST